MHHPALLWDYAKRLSAFDKVRDITLEVLASDAAQDALEGREAPLVETLESSFVVCQRRGVMHFPAGEVESDNLGVYPILENDKGIPVTYDADLLRSKDRADLRANHPVTFEELAGQLGSAGMDKEEFRAKRDDIGPHVTYGVISVSGDQGQPLSFAERPLMMLPAEFVADMGKVAAAAIVSHELDHAVKLRSLMTRKALREWLFDENGEAANLAAGAVLLERSAYDVAARLFTIVHPPVISENAFVRRMRHMEPQEAGGYLMQLRKEGALDTLTDMQQLQLAPVHARALTRLFSGGFNPSEQEVIAYGAGGYVRSGKKSGVLD